MTPLTTGQQSAVEAPVARVAYFLEMQFLSGTVRVCSYGATFNWNGYDWIGLGTVGNISPVEETAGLLSSAMMFTLNVAQPATLSLAVGAPEQYRGRPAKLYFCPLDVGGNLIDTPILCWRGTMDTSAVGVDGEAGQIVLKCETSAFTLKKLNALRLNDAQQSQRMSQQGLPVDTGFQFLTNLIANPQLWLSRKFQMV
jgi:hypothetical protein